MIAEREMELQEYKKDTVESNCFNTNSIEAYACAQDQEHCTYVTLLDDDQKVTDTAMTESVTMPCAAACISQMNLGVQEEDLELPYIGKSISLPVEPESFRGSGGGMLYCIRTIGSESQAECCRICQQNTEDPLVELGCQCRGELSKAHSSCIEHWFSNKGSNKCEICQSVATNISAPAAQPTQKFWIWRTNGNDQSSSALQRSQERARFHPLWVALLILIAGLLFDVLISVFLGASALPVNIIIGVLVVLGIGTAARLIVECWHERGLRRNVTRVEMGLRTQDL